jgi:putative ABC transport system permease protein
VKIRRNFGFSRKALLRHRVRTALAISGTGVGVAAMLVMVAVGEGAERELMARIDAMGRNLLVVTARPAQPLVGRSTTGGLANTLTPADARAILDQIARIERAAPSMDDNLQVKYGTLATRTTVRATTPEFESIRNFRTIRGRYFTEEEDRARLRVAVLGSRVVETLFASIDPVGETVRIGRVPFEVIGVLESKGASLNSGSDEDNQILIPLRTGLRRVFNVDYLNLVYLQVREGEEMDAAAAEISSLLRRRHRLEVAAKPDDFRVRNQLVILEAERETAASFQRLITALASIALLVGGVGILSIMLLSIRERRNEIGLRVAVGAKRRDVRMQFLVEALILGGGGGLVGLAFGLAAAASIGWATEWRTVVSVPAVALAMGAALSISLVFGVYPAQRASALNPIESLRAE